VGRSSGSTPPPTVARPTGPSAMTPPGTSVKPSFVGHARSPEVALYSSSEADEPSLVLGNPTETGAPLVFLLVDPPRQERRVEVMLPVRPNGSRGWVDARDLSITSHHYRIEVHTTGHRLVVSESGRAVMSVPIAVGTHNTPTPGGTFYVKELLRPPDPGGPYGSYAYGLSGFSNVISSFGSGDGVIGIHGTNEPGSIGRDVSHGCIRMLNEDIERLATFLPLGTPVEIVDR
jgi:hypothetical protein